VSQLQIVAVEEMVVTVVVPVIGSEKPITFPFASKVVVTATGGLVPNVDVVMLFLAALSYEIASDAPVLVLPAVGRPALSQAE
jgi:hypothetical protein